MSSSDTGRVKKQSSKRPIEKIFTGSWNAVKKVPEAQGKGALDLYDKLKFSKLTPEEKKVHDKVHVFLKEHQKAVGWGAFTAEAAAFTFVIVKGYTSMRGRRGQEATRTAEGPPRRRVQPGARIDVQQTEVTPPREVRRAVEEAVQSLLSPENGIVVFEHEKFGSIYGNYASIQQMPIEKVRDVARACFQEWYGRVAADPKLIERVNLQQTGNRQSEMITHKILEHLHEADAVAAIRRDMFRIVDLLRVNNGPAKPPDPITMDYLNPLVLVDDNILSWAAKKWYPGIRHIGVVISNQR